MTAEKLTKSQRLDILGELLVEIACGLRNVQQALTDEDYTANTLALVVDVLGRLGWLADQGCVVVRDTYSPVVGDAHDWMLRPELLDRLGKDMAARMRQAMAKNDR